MGLSAPVKCTTLADANERHDWRIFAEFAQCLIDEARGLYAEEPFGIDLAGSVAAGICSDQRIRLTGKHTADDYPERLRRIHLNVPETGTPLVLLTNNFKLPAVTIAALYKARWQVELFFKWIKPYLRIKQFYGTTENAVKTQIWVAISVYVLIAIIKKRLKLAPSLYRLLQVLSLTLFVKTTLQEPLQGATPLENNRHSANQLNLFVF